MYKNNRPRPRRRPERIAETTARSWSVAGAQVQMALLAAFGTGGLSFSPIAAAQETTVPSLAPVEVHAPSPSRARLNDARSQRSLTPGNATVVEGDSVRQAAVLGMEDALVRVPGVYVRNPSGQVSARISMRGSGITSSTGTRGVRLLRDGLPLARIDDISDSIYADAMGADFIEVFRGANGMAYGAATLGGALNLVSPTGLTQAGTRLRADVGPYGYRNTRAQWGGKLGEDADAFLAATATASDGARENAGYRVNRFYGNVGYRYSATSRGRFHYTQEYFRVNVPGAISRQQLEENPRAANPASARADARIRTRPRWHAAYVHEWDTNADDTLSAGVFHTGTRYRTWGTLYDVEYDAVDYGIVLRHEMNGSVAGRDTRFTWGVNLGQGHDENGAAWAAAPGIPAFLSGRSLAHVEGERSNLEAYAQWSWQVAPRWSVIVAGQGVKARRSADNRVEPAARAWFADGEASTSYTGFSPRIGFVWDASPRTQIFGNLSGSFEPPNSVNFFTPDGLLKPQRATTLELGTRGGSRELAWEAAVYYARVRDELIEAPMPGNPAVSVARNADQTRHIGLELGLSGELGLGSVPGRVGWSVAYTWNDFRFHDDARFGNNRLPGIPAHVLRLDMRYRHPSGFYAGPSLEVASGWNVDQADSLRAPGYGVLNAGVGYLAPDERLRLYLDVRNVTDKHYAAATEYTIDARGQADLQAFIPGGSRTIFAGAEFRW